MSPTVRIVMPVYNGERFVEAAARSVISQTFSDWELVVVDDGSTDRTPEILSKIVDPRVKVWHQPNGGPESARRRGREGCEAQFIARMDSDDVMEPRRLARQVEFLNAHPEIGALGGQIVFLNESGTRTGFPSSWPLAHDEISERISSLRCALCNPTLICRTEIEEQIPPTPYGGPGADFDYVLRLTSLTRVANLSDVVHFMRIHPHSIQSSSNWRRRRERTRYALACAEARRLGAPEPSFDDFRGRPIVTRAANLVADARESWLSSAVRSAQSAMLDRRCSARAVAAAGISFLLAPGRTLGRSLSRARGGLPATK